MPGCTRLDLAHAGALALALTLALGGCSRSDTDGQFEIYRLESHWGNGRLETTCEQRLQLSAEARRALEHGVPLTIEVELILREMPGRKRVSGATRRYEIRYLPLSEHYRVSGIGTHDVATFPRLRHALAELSRLDFSLAVGALPTGDYEVLARSRLDHGQMPPPMRLPALFDPDWRHVSEWTSGPLIIGPEA
jgi:hypothetical protein